MQQDLLEKLTLVQGKKFEDPVEIFDDIKNAYHLNLNAYLEPSPLRKSIWLSEYIEGDVWLKLESLNPNGSFKARGALHAMSELKKKYPIPEGERLKVCAASAGNHAQGVAYAAKHLNCECHIFIPEGAPLVKREATKKLGAHVYLAGQNLEEAFEAALKFSKESNAHFMHAYNSYDVIIGQSTCAYETLLQYQDLNSTDNAQPPLELFLNKPYLCPDYFICSFGGGGLATGAALLFKALKSCTNVIGVEQEFYNSAYKSFESKKHIPSTKSKSTIADGIAVGLIGNLNYDYMIKYLEKITTVNDDSIVKAILALCENEHVVSEGAGAVGIAELLENPSQYKGKKVVVCVSGGNIDPQLLTRVIARGLHITGRVLRVNVCVSDKPGGLRNLLQFVAEKGGNVLDLIHDRTYSEVSIGDVDVVLSLETKNNEHQLNLLKGLEDGGFKPRMLK